MAPAVFVINTFWADELLQQVDPFVGQTPVVYLRRQLFEGLKNSVEANSNQNTSLIIQKMTPRLSVRWDYGSQTSDEVASYGARALFRFLQDGRFSILEDFAHAQTYEMLKSSCGSAAGLARHANT